MHLTTYLPSSLLTKDYLRRQIALVILNKGYNLRCIHPHHQISFQVAISKKFKNITHSNILNVIYPPRFSCSTKVSHLFPHSKGCDTRIGDPEPDQRLLSHIKGLQTAEDPLIFFFQPNQTRSILV